MRCSKIPGSLLAALFTLLTVTSCGGGGGGGTYMGPAIVGVDADPSRIDSGDRTTVTIRLYEVNDDGIMLKIRVPVGLDYVSDSGFLTVDGIEVNLDPAFSETDTKYNYVVYFLRRALFGEDNQGELRIQFEGSAAIAAGTVDVDPDIDNPDISNTAEFDVKNPKFSAEDSKDLVVSN